MVESPKQTGLPIALGAKNHGVSLDLRMQRGAMAKGHAGCSHQPLHFLFMQRAFDKLVPETPVRGHEQMAFNDENRRYADRHALICMQAAFRKVVRGKDGVQVQRRDSRKIDKTSSLTEANRSEGVTMKASVWSGQQ